MNQKKKMGLDFKSLKYVPKLFTSLLFLLLFVCVFLLFSGRKIEFLRIEFLLKLMPDFYQHVSNFALSFLLYTGIGYFWLMMGMKFKNIIVLGIFLLLANLIYELYIPILNTPDPVDAYFGFVGTFFGFIFLFFVDRFGLKRNPNGN